jgi:hypothetical protein
MTILARPFMSTTFTEMNKNHYYLRSIYLIGYIVNSFEVVFLFNKVYGN